MADPEAPPDLLAVADRLYGLPLAEFTAARDAEVKAHRGTDLAVRLKALRKPATAAWVVNLLVRRESEQVDQVLAVGRALREAQEQMAGEQLRELARQRRQLTAAVTTQARRVAREEGSRVTDAVADQVEATLTAAMVDEQCAAAVRSGMLVHPLETTGVDALARDDVLAAVAVPEALGFVAPPRAAPAGAAGDAGDAPDGAAAGAAAGVAAGVAAGERAAAKLRVVPDPEADRKARAAAQERLAAAEADVAEAEGALEEARSAQADLEARSLQVQAEIEELRGRIAELEEQAEEVDDELAEAEDACEDAAAAAAAARSAREQAVAALGRLRGSSGG